MLHVIGFQAHGHQATAPQAVTDCLMCVVLANWAIVDYTDIMYV